MQHMLSVVATFAVLVAMSGIVPIIITVSATAQEVRPIETVRGQEQQRAETIDINSLTLDSDFSVFMRPGCPAELRLKALRKLWMLLPPVPIDENAAI
jgi:hypothetical protein